MALTELERARARKTVSAFVEGRRPPHHLRQQVDLAFRLSGQSVEIFEVRQVYGGEPGERIELPVAKATYVRTVRKNGTISFSSAIGVPIVPDNPGIFTACDDPDNCTDPRPGRVLHYSDTPTGTVLVDGTPTAGDRARAECLFDEAAARGIPSLGIGDNGNELGFGLIADAVAKYKPNGARLCTRVKTDVLIPANTSNWVAFNPPKGILMRCMPGASQKVCGPFVAAVGYSRMRVVRPSCRWPLSYRWP